MDGSREQAQPRSGMMQHIWKYDIRHLITEPYRHNQNRAKGVIVEQIQALHHKLCSFGVPMDGPADVFCDNRVVTKATRLPESKLPKKHNAVSCYKVQEAVAMGMIQVAWEDTKTNLVDFLTKTKTRPERERG